MALKSAWAYHNAGRELRQSLEGAKAYKQPRPTVSRAEDTERRAKLDEAFETYWDGLTVGSTLTRIGLATTVAKMNTKSLVTTGGVKWTKAELRGLLG